MHLQVSEALPLLKYTENHSCEHAICCLGMYLSMNLSIYHSCEHAICCLGIYLSMCISIYL
jgi:hypothetical protein